MNALSDSAPPLRRLWETRIVLVLMSIVLPGVGLHTMHLPVYDPFAARAFFTVVAVGLLVGSYRVRWLLPRLHLAVQGLAHAEFLWYIHVAHQNGVTQDDAIGMVPLSMIASVFVRSRRELLSGLTLQLLAFGWLVASVDTPTYSPNVLAFICLLLSIGMGVLSYARADLEDQLSNTNRRLESMVDERTAELADSLRLARSESQERLRAERTALRASRAKSTFLANMSHELRTPLNAIVGYSEMVVEELDDRPDLHADLDRVGRAAVHLLGLIDGILDLARVEAQEVDLRIEAVDLRALVDEAKALVPSFTTDVTFDNAVGQLYVMADAPRLRQVLVNLLGNAQKFTSTGGVTVAARCAGERVVLDVADTGTGIAPDDLERVFDRFVQADRQHEGTGLGLAVCRMLVDQMGGQISVVSTIDHGSTFSVGLTRASPPGSGQPAVLGAVDAESP